MELEYIKEDIIERCQSELADHGLYLEYKVKEMSEEVKAVEKMLERYLKEKTERTENDRDFIATVKLWDVYDSWRQETVTNLDEYKKTDIRSTKALGMIMKRIGKYERDQRKEGRGYKKLRWKSESTKVTEFLSEMIVKTESESKVNRIEISEMLKKYYEWLDRKYENESTRNEKIGLSEFVIRVRKNGYETNTGYLHQKKETKVVRVGTQRVKYIANIKWKEE